MKEEKNQKQKFFKVIEDWGLFVIAIIIIVSFVVFSALQPIEKDLLGIIINNMFLVLNLLAAFYISRQVSLWGWKTENLLNQKKIAKTAIRHNRGNLTSLLRVIKITDEKINLVEDPLIAQYLKEIKNHLQMTYQNMTNSEADFYEIVNEELKEQNHLEIEISTLFDEIEKKNKDLKALEEEKEADKNTINKLRKSIKEKENEAALKAARLPFGVNNILGRTPPENLDYLNREIETPWNPSPRPSFFSIPGQIAGNDDTLKINLKGKE